MHNKIFENGKNLVRDKDTSNESFGMQTPIGKYAAAYTKHEWNRIKIFTLFSHSLTVLSAVGIIFAYLLSFVNRK
jgi:hypothetical protein